MRTLVGFFLMLMLFSLQALAQFRAVTVQNANSNPVPITVQNTPTVNVNGTVPVSGTVAVAGPVNATRRSWFRHTLTVWLLSDLRMHG
jgi:hypothetical protein